MSTPATGANGTAPTPPPDGPVGLSIDLQEVLDYSAALWAQTLATAHTEAARWRSAALGGQRRVAELEARVSALESHPAGRPAAPPVSPPSGGASRAGKT